MSDFPRLANSMSAIFNGFAPHRNRVHAAMVSLALAATLLPCAHASARHSAPARTPVTRTRKVAAESPEPRVATRGKQSAMKHKEPVAAITRAVGRHSSTSLAVDRHHAPVDRGRLLAVHGHNSPAARSFENYKPLSELAAERPVKRRSHTPDADLVADRSTEERVHAWYRAHNAAAAPPKDTSAAVDAKKLPMRAAIIAATESTTSDSKHTANSQPDLSLTPRQATSADFERAVQRQTETIRAAVAVKSTRTTADDDAAFAEASKIPSTAPTEREPAPFIHGSLPPNTAPVSSPPRQATLTAKADAPAITHIDPRGDAEVLSAATGSTAVAVNLKNGDTVPMPAPKAAPILRVPAPAVAAVTAAASKPKLDPRLADALTQQTFDDDETPSPAAATLAGKPAHLDPGVKPSAAGGYDLDLTGSPMVKVNLYDNVGKLILLPAMKGSHEILVHQNQMAIADGLDRVEDDSQMLEMRRVKLLVALPDNDSMQPDGRLPLNRRFARPWTVRFLNDLSQAHFARFHTPLIVTSAVRTVAFQRRLVLTNGNAAPPTGEVASPHLYGQAVDIAKHGMSMTEIAWMRSYLTPVESAGKIDVEEEFQQACFHLSVYRRYLGLPAPRSTPTPEVAPSRMLQQAKTTPARRRHIPSALLATGLR